MVWFDVGQSLVGVNTAEDDVALDGGSEIVTEGAVVEGDLPNFISSGLVACRGDLRYCRLRRYRSIVL